MKDQSSDRSKPTFDQNDQLVDGNQTNVAGDLYDKRVKLSTSNQPKAESIVNLNLGNHSSTLSLLGACILIVTAALFFVLLRNDEPASEQHDSQPTPIPTVALETQASVPATTVEQTTIPTLPATLTAVPAPGLAGAATLPQDPVAAETPMSSATRTPTSPLLANSTERKLIFEDNFDSSLASSWSSVGIATTEAGKAVIDQTHQNPGFNEVTLLIGEKTWENYRISVDLDLISVPMNDEDQYYGMNREVIIVFNENTELGEFQGLSFKNSLEEIFSPSAYQYQGSNVPRLEPAFSLPVKSAPQFHVAIEVKAEEITVYIDDLLVGTRSLPKHIRGRAGVILKVYGANTQSPTIDNFRVEQMGL